MTHVPEVAVMAVNLFSGCRNWDVAFLRICDRIMPRLNVPFAPGSNNLELWSERFIGELKSHLIVAFAGAAVRQSVRAFRQRHFHLPLCQQRPRDRGPEQVLAFVGCPGFNERPEIFSYEFVSKV